MTFEVFKSHQGNFIAVDSPEKMDHIRGMYNIWLLMQEDAKFLEPVEKEFADEFHDKNYYKIIESTFNPLQLKNGEVNILVLPSFKNEYQLKFSLNDVKLTFVVNQILSNFFLGFNPRKKN